MTARIGFWDIEMAPATAHVWGLFDQNIGIGQVREDPYMLSFAWRWLGEKKVIFKSSQDADMLSALHALFEEADAIVSWNGVGFDTKHAAREFIFAEMLPPAWPKEMDLMRGVKYRFRFLSNKLDYVSNYLGVGKKSDTGGHQLWIDCMRGDVKAWAKMRRYNIQDVNLLVDLYNILLPWLPASMIPNAGLYGATPGDCPRCGSEHIQRRGSYPTLAGRYPRFQCQNCGGWFKDKTLIKEGEEGYAKPATRPL